MKSAGALAWTAFLCGVAAWITAPFLFLGFEPFAIVFGIVALRKGRAEQKLERYAAWTGIVLGSSKLVVYGVAFLCLLYAFWRNPVAH